MFVLNVRRQRWFRQTGLIPPALALIVEFGPLNESIHKIDEHVRVADLEPLSTIYERTILSVWNRVG